MYTSYAHTYKGLQLQNNQRLKERKSRLNVVNLSLLRIKVYRIYIDICVKK